MLRPTMLQYVALTWCDRLAWALDLSEKANQMGALVVRWDL